MSSLSATAQVFDDDTVEIVVSGLEAGAEAVRAAAAILTSAERGRANRLLSESDRRRFIVCRARLRQLLASRLDVRPESIELVYGPHGKPALAPGHGNRDLRFNLSHSDDLAVYAFSTGREIGIDVEAIHWIREAEDIAARFFSCRENDVYRALNASDKPLAFFNCWTRKEAFIKAVGDGLSHPLDRFDVSLEPGQPATILRIEDTPGEECGWKMESFSPAPGFTGAVVTETH